MKLIFKGVEFDDYTRNDDAFYKEKGDKPESAYWSQVCIFCQEKYKAKFAGFLDDHGGGACGVKGCNTPDHDKTLYINFPQDADLEVYE